MPTPEKPPKGQPTWDPWKEYRDSGCTCQVEDAGGGPTIVLYSLDCPIETHRFQAKDQYGTDGNTTDAGQA
jgi:hypothetical protein